MSFRATRAKRTRSFHCEALEDRSLLNAAIPASPKAEIHTLKQTSVIQTIQGSLSGPYSGENQQVTTSGKGTLTVIGPVTMTGQYRTKLNLKTHSLTMTGGTGTMTNGTDSVSVKFTGSGKIGNGEITFTMKGTITGGTGHYKGATGSFSSYGTAPELSFGTYHQTVTATVKTRV